MVGWREGEQMAELVDDGYGMGDEASWKEMKRSRIGRTRSALHTPWF